MRSVRPTVLGIASILVLVSTGRAAALTTISIDKCVAGQLRSVARAVIDYAGCHATAAAKAVATDPVCLDKVTRRLTSELTRLEGQRTCQVEGAASVLASDAADYVANLDATVGHAFKCDGKKTLAAARFAGALVRCYAVAATKTGVVNGRCIAKANAAIGTAIPNAEIGIAQCSALSQLGVLGAAAEAFANDETCRIDVGNSVCNGIATPTPTRTPTPAAPTVTPTVTLSPTPTVTATPVCNDGINSPGEPCDPSAPSSGWGACRPDQACTSCTCACPSSMVLTGDAADDATILDLGWTGIAHRQPMPSDGTITVRLDCPAAMHPCGTCAVSGPIPNPEAGAGQLDNRRCTTNPAKHCADDATCAARSCLGGANDGVACAASSECPSGTCPLAGTCGYYAHAPLSLAAGGVAMCLVQRVVGSVGGTADVETGYVAMATTLATGVHAGSAIDAPCPRCSDPGGLNDGTAGGTCDAGPRLGLACDANAVMPGRPDFGRTSLDCPPLPAALVADLAWSLENETEVVTRTLTPESPNCTSSGYFTSKCLCDTCNDAAAEPCRTNADCPPSGGNPGVCGGRRCLSGTNAGAPCVTNTQCPAGVCGRPGGKPSQPNACVDDEYVVGLNTCVDGDGDEEGECLIGPTDQQCVLASGHGQRGCSTDGDCGGAPGSCGTTQRKCFLTGGGSFQSPGGVIGADTLNAFGTPSAPVGGVSHPTLASVFCVAPVGSPAMNSVAGLPGPARVTVKTTARLQP